MKPLTQQQIKNLQPDNLVKLLNKHGIKETSKLCGVHHGTIYERIKEYKIVKRYIYEYEK